MKPTIETYKYYFIKREAEHLLSVYSSVNDNKTVETVQALAAEKIRGLFETENEEAEAFLKLALDRTWTKAKAEQALEELKEAVIPFEQPEKKQIEKIFRKTKKLKFPNWSELDLREHTYIGWNDPGTQKKFILFYKEKKLQGISGTISPTIIKGVCSICQKTSNVSMFLATTKASSDGTYTKRGNYICHDSDQCNKQLVQLDKFYEFAEIVKKEK
jgi:hypothetical protein